MTTTEQYYLIEASVDGESWNPFIISPNGTFSRYKTFEEAYKAVEVYATCNVRPYKEFQIARHTVTTEKQCYGTYELIGDK